MKFKLPDPMSGLTHFIGIILAAIGLVILLTRPDRAFTVWHAVGFSVFGGAMVMLYTCSTLYHWLPLTGRRRELFRKIDHIMIFIFIAASYTPICLVTLRGAWGWSILGTVWGIAALGLIMKLFWLNAPRLVYTLIYVLMGWVIVVGIWPLTRALAWPGLLWLLIGGLFYTAGAGIYAARKPNPWPRAFGFHEIFHIFVMVGSFSHFWMIYRYV
ncbi:MAG: hemolysin III family protein [Desulfosarcina sp.]|nr:hemolysin III family protein [Desulfobacterales bacterium]